MPHNRVPDLLRTEPLPIEAKRFRRAVSQLKVERIEGHPFHFRVRGGSETRWVVLYPYFDCDCPDFMGNGKICSHVIACLVDIESPRLPSY